MKPKTTPMIEPKESDRSGGRWLCALVLFGALLFSGPAGCQTSGPAQIPAGELTAMTTAPVVIHPGDVVQISFPGAPQMMGINERVRVDGKLALPLIPEVVAAGKTPAELQAQLARLYESELQINEVVVILASSSSSIFVSGAVARPGRIAMERPLTVLDAIMEAGGFDPRRANVKKVTVIRKKDGKYSRHILNLKPVLKGEDVQPFSLEPFDIIFIPEKIF